MQVWLAICSKLQGSELQRILPQSTATAQGQDYLFHMRKKKERLKPLDKEHKYFHVFFNNINTFFFSTALGLTVKLLATYSHDLPNPKIKNFGNLLKLHLYYSL